jgi:hypothetical protein
MIGRRSVGLVVVFGAGALLVGVLGVSAAPVLASAKPKPPPMCSLVSPATASLAAGNVSLSGQGGTSLSGRSLRGRAGVRLLGALAGVESKSSKATACYFVRRNVRLQVVFLTKVIRAAFVRAAGQGLTTNDPSLGDAAFSVLSVGGSLRATSDLYFLVGSTAFRMGPLVASSTPGITEMQTLAGTKVVTALRAHGPT